MSEVVAEPFMELLDTALLKVRMSEPLPPINVELETVPVNE